MDDRSLSALHVSVMHLLSFQPAQLNSYQCGPLGHSKQSNKWTLMTYFFANAETWTCVGV